MSTWFSGLGGEWRPSEYFIYGGGRMRGGWFYRSVIMLKGWNYWGNGWGDWSRQSR